MTTSTHKTTCTQFDKHWPPPHCLWQWKMFTICMRLVYLLCPTKQDIAQGKVCVCKNQKDHLTLAFVINTTCTDKLKPRIIYISLRPRCFGRWLPTYYVWWFTNRMAWMTSHVLESWMMASMYISNLKSRRYSNLWTIMLLIPLSMLVEVNYLIFHPCSRAIFLLLSYHLVLQVCSATLGSRYDCFIQSLV